ncbi:MAG: transposase [Firmicutes bacterium]|nr:transposase [Bacillota bacterium]
MNLPKRKINRLTEYDYSQEGAYFITICALNKSHLFGNIVGSCIPVRQLMEEDLSNGRLWTSAPTISQIVSSLKSFVSKKAGFDVWQKSFYDHIIRNHDDYEHIWEYIDTNTDKWHEDKYYS